MQLINGIGIKGATNMLAEFVVEPVGYAEHVNLAGSGFAELSED